MYKWINVCINSHLKVSLFKKRLTWVKRKILIFEKHEIYFENARLDKPIITYFWVFELHNISSDFKFFQACNTRWNGANQKSSFHKTRCPSWQARNFSSRTLGDFELSRKDILPYVYGRIWRLNQYNKSYIDKYQINLWGE